MRILQLFWRALASVIAGAVLVSPSVSVAASTATTEPPTYLIDQSFRPQLAPPPTPGSAAAQAEIDELMALDKSRNDDQYWRVAYWNRGAAVGPWLRVELGAIAAHII